MMQKPKILAADNTKVALRYMETILGDIYDVTLVQTGMSVLDCLKSEIPDLILISGLYGSPVRLLGQGIFAD